MEAFAATDERLELKHYHSWSLLDRTASWTALVLFPMRRGATSNGTIELSIEVLRVWPMQARFPAFYARTLQRSCYVIQSKVCWRVYGSVLSIVE